MGGGLIVEFVVSGGGGFVVKGEGVVVVKGEGVSSSVVKMFFVYLWLSLALCPLSISESLPLSLISLLPESGRDCTADNASSTTDSDPVYGNLR